LGHGCRNPSPVLLAAEGQKENGRLQEALIITAGDASKDFISEQDREV
jgi:hypothetical protein